MQFNRGTMASAAKVAAFFLVSFALPGGCAHHPKLRVASGGEERLIYPHTATVDQIDEYHGVRVADPYRWLEDTDAPAVKEWIEEQNRLTFSYLAEIPEREAIHKRLTQLWNYERYGLPQRRGGRYFYTRNDGLQNQSVLYMTSSLEGEPKVLLDPNTLSPDGTIALAGYEVSEDGRWLAYGLSVAGSDWEEWKVRDVASGQDLDDRVQWVKYSETSWTRDGLGFFYSRFDEPKQTSLHPETLYYQKLYYHRIGTPQSQDSLICERPDQKDWGFSGAVTEDGRYLIISVSKGTDDKNLIFYKDLAAPGGGVVELLREFEASYGLIGNDGPIFWFRTNLNAPRGRIIAIDLRAPARENWKEIVPEREESLSDVSMVGDRLLASYLKDAHTQVRVHQLDGTFIREVALPGLGSARGFNGRKDDPETFFVFASFTTPATIYRYDVQSGTVTLFRKPKVQFDPEDYQTEQIFYRSKDGTRVPMFLTHRKGIRLDGENPTLLTGYGGFNIPMTPYFSVRALVWMEAGGIYAVANLRGGGEYGEEWHQAGVKLQKQNVFDDFIAAAEWLIANRYTRTGRLAIDGGSNGGLLVGACMVQRPDLFGAVSSSVGVLDMLRFDKFTVGWAWVSDYGSPSDPEEFRALYAYSPLHNVKAGTSYPATLITTGDHDDRVLPAHSLKFAATLQAAQAGPAPILIRIETRAGHGGGKPMSMVIDEIADTHAFLVRALKVGAKVGKG